MGKSGMENSNDAFNRRQTGSGKGDGGDDEVRAKSVRRMDTIRPAPCTIASLCNSVKRHGNWPHCTTRSKRAINEASAAFYGVCNYSSQPTAHTDKSQANIVRCSECKVLFVLHVNRNFAHRN